MRRWIRWTFALWLAVLAYGVFGPAPADEVTRAGKGLRDLEAEVRDRVDPAPTTTVAPGAAPTVVATTLAPPTPAEPRWFDDVSAEELLNVLLFVPFGVLVPLGWRRLRWWTVPLGVALSCAIELVQGAFLSWRSQTLVDVETNSLGAVIGFALWLALLAAAPRLEARLSGRAAQSAGNIPRRGSSV